MEQIHYLVRLRHNMDDLPLFITGDKETAIMVAKDAPWQPKAEILRALDVVDISTPVRIDVIEFRGGIPKDVVFVRDFESEEAAA